MMLTDFQALSDEEAEDVAWQILLAARALIISGRSGLCLSYDKDQREVVVSDKSDSGTCLRLDQAGNWFISGQVSGTVRAMFDLYLPVLGNSKSRARVVAHLGQSIDSRIATTNGDAFYVTGEANRKHLHCLRALSDAVIVGASTVLADNPQLTTRAVPGDNPVRIVIDPHARLKGPLGLFDDAQAPTRLIHRSSADLSGEKMLFGPSLHDRQGNSRPQVERWVVPDTDTDLPVGKILQVLAARKLDRLFVEGGGVTVSRFFDAGCLDRLHIAVAPVLVGNGVQALQIAGVDRMMNAHRPACAVFRMGEDVLWDFDVGTLRNRVAKDNDASVDAEPGKPSSGVQRLF